MPQIKQLNKITANQLVCIDWNNEFKLICV